MLTYLKVPTFGIPIAKFSIGIPSEKQNFEHFTRENASKFVFINDSFIKTMRDEKSFPFKKGELYSIEIVPILRPVSSFECLEYLQSHNGLLVGYNAFALLSQLDLFLLPFSRHYLSFGENHLLRKEDVSVPYWGFINRNKWILDMGYFSGQWYSNHALIYFKRAS